MRLLALLVLASVVIVGGYLLLRPQPPRIVFSSAEVERWLPAGESLEDIACEGLCPYGFPSGPYWRPGDEQVRSAEDAVARRLDRARSEAPPDARVRPLRAYGLQFLGVEHEGRPLIHVNGFCDADHFGETASRWVGVADGGSCYFRAIYDAGSGELEWFGFNGSA